VPDRRRGVLLRREQDLLVRAHDLFERVDRLFPSDEERNDHVGKNDDVAQRQHRVGVLATLVFALLWFAHVTSRSAAISGRTARAPI
jgi:hypothetical protein